MARAVSTARCRSNQKGASGHVTQPPPITTHLQVRADRQLQPGLGQPRPRLGGLLAASRGQGRVQAAVLRSHNS